MMRSIFAVFAVVVAAGSLHAATATVDGTVVTYDGIPRFEAEMLARTASAARDVYVKEFGFRMPDLIRFSAKRGADQKLLFYTDCVDGLYLSHPLGIGVNGAGTLWGICHELGHIAVYSATPDLDWGSTHAWEGWPCWSACVVTDYICDAQQENIWTRPSDFRSHGIARLRKALAKGDAEPIWRAAGEWEKLDAIIGHKGFVKLFAAWQAAHIDPIAPDMREIRERLLAVCPEKRQALTEWWELASPLLPEGVRPSPFKAQTLPVDRLTGQPVSLYFDDGTAEEPHHSTAAGPGVLFTAPSASEWYLTSVRVFGARYGPAGAPAGTFRIYLCDTEANPIASWEKSCGGFPEGEMKWTRFDVPATRVPHEFWLYLQYRSTPASGVNYGLDRGPKDRSAHGMLLGSKRIDEIEPGEWMIRAQLDYPKVSATDKRSTVGPDVSPGPASDR